MTYSIEVFDTSEIELPLQFTISEKPTRELQNFKSLFFNGLRISAHCKLGIYQIINPSGTPIGLFFGMPIDIEKEKLISKDIRLSEDLCSSIVPSFLENYAGSYIFLFTANGEKKIFLDADGTMSLVYDPIEKVAGSTAAALLDNKSYFERLRSNQFRNLDVKTLGWFPSTLTAHKGIKRLLCNHFLDLNTWGTSRFWPLEITNYSSYPSAEVDKIRIDTVKTLKALVRSNKVMQSLTAGYETRFLLSCAKDLLEDISFFTITSSTIDTDIAKVLKQKFNLSLLLLPVIQSNSQQRREWLYRSGHAIGGINLVTHPTISQFGDNTVLSIGLGGEVGRGFFWNKKDDTNTVATAEKIVGRFGLPFDQAILEKTDDWLAALPSGLDFFSILDLAYLELRMASWAYAQSYAQDAICQHISPMISYRNYKSMFSVSPEMKMNNYILLQAISDGWPDLLQSPINCYGNWKDLVALVEKLSNPKRIISKMRKIISS